MSGNIATKSFSEYQVNEALLAKVVEAIRKGEADARRSGEVRSFEIFYNGFRSRIVMGRIMIVPAKAADSIEDFPSALLYGALVREIRPEDLADLYTYKLGESEFDEYDKKSLTAIKEKLFKDEQGAFRSIIVFIPTWANVRNYVILKFTRDVERLTQMVRQQIYGSYFDPRLSSCFDHMANDTTHLDVSEINQKLIFPGLVENPAGRQEPELKPGDGGVRKEAATVKPIVLLAAETADEFNEEALEPGEKAVMAALAEGLEAKLAGDAATPEPAPEPEEKEAALKTAAKVNYSIWFEHGAWMWEITRKGTLGRDKVVGAGFEGSEAEAKNAVDRKLQELGVQPNELPQMALASVDDSGAETGLRRQPDYGESDSHTAEANELAKEGSEKKQIKVKCPECGNGSGFRTKEGLLKCFGCSHEWEEKKATARIAAQVGGEVLVQRGGQFAVQAKNGYREILRVHGNKIKWARPLQFTAAFRQAAELFVRNPKNNKQADVPLTFDAIWSDIAEDFGPAPVVDVKTESPTAVSSPEPNSSTRMDKLHELRPYLKEKTEGAGAAEGEKKPEGEEPKEEKKPWEKDASAKQAGPFAGPALQPGERVYWNDKSMGFKRVEGTVNPAGYIRWDDGQITRLNDSRMMSCVHRVQKVAGQLGHCIDCQKSVTASDGSEVAPEIFRHRACQERAKRAAFDLFIPGQVLKEFYPDILRETVEYPTESFDTSEYVNPSSLTAPGDKAVPTGPSAAMGLGRDGKSQVLEGAPLRQENDIRGYQFDQEFYSSPNTIDPRAFRAAYVIEKINKKAGVEEFKAQFADFLKKAMGEIAATFIGGFKVTSRPLMNKVPGTGELKLDVVEGFNTPVAVGTTEIGSRVRFLVGKLTDSQIQDAINSAWASSSVYNEDPNGGYTYEVFVRPSALDKSTLVLSYEFVIGTKGL